MISNIEEVTEYFKKISNNNTIIFTNGNESRYKCNSNQLTKHPEGNVIGIFYFDNFVSMKYDNDKQDKIKREIDEILIKT